MKKICLNICLIFMLLSNVNASTSKDIMIKYKYTDNTSKYTKELIDDKVEYQINEDKVKILLNESKNINVMFFQVSTDSLEWLKSKIDINKEANVYYFKLLNNSDNNITSNITIEEYSGVQKKITIYDENGNKIEKIKNDCYVIIEKLENKEIENNENINIYIENVDTIKGHETSRLPLIIFVIFLTIIFIILHTIVKIRKDKDNE